MGVLYGELLTLKIGSHCISQEPKRDINLIIEKKNLKTDDKKVK